MLLNRFIITALSLFILTNCYAYDPRAKQIQTDTSNFTNNLGANDTNVQKALETLDELTVAGGNETDPVWLAEKANYSLITHNHNLSELLERSYNSLTDKPDFNGTFLRKDQDDLTPFTIQVNKLEIAGTGIYISKSGDELAFTDSVSGTKLLSELGGGVNNFSALSDVNWTGVQNNQIPRWDASQGKLVPSDDQTGNGTSSFVTFVQENGVAKFNSGAGNITFNFGEQFNVTDLGNITIKSLSWSLLTNVPNLVNSFNTRFGDVMPEANDYTWAQIDKTTSNISDITNRSHFYLTDIGNNTHVQIDAHISNVSNPHNVTVAQVGGIPTSYLDVDATLTNNSDTRLATQKAIKTYVDDIALEGKTWKDPVINLTLQSPPASNTTGDRYIVNATGSGGWAGYNYNITEWNGTAWNFETPSLGWTVIVTDENLAYTYNNISWVSSSPTNTITASNGVKMVVSDAQIDLSDTNPSLEVADGGLRSKVDNVTIERASGGLQVKDSGINNSKIGETVSVTKGGIGLASLGSANTLLGVNNSGTGYEDKTLVAGANVTITHSGKNITIASTGGGSGNATGSGFLYTSLVYHAHPSSYWVWTNLPINETLAVTYIRADLTDAVQYRIGVNQQVAGLAGSDINLKYSTNGVTFYNCSNITGAGELDVGTGTGLKMGSWTDIVAGAKGDVWLAIAAKQGDGIVDPSFREIWFEFKRNGYFVDYSTQASDLVDKEVIFHASPTVYTYTNLPAALTELGTAMRMKIDLSNCVSYRIQAQQSTAGLAGTDINLQYSTDQVNWYAVDSAAAGELDIGTGTGLKTGGWADIVTAAKSEVFIRLVTKQGDGIVDPAFRRIVLQLREYTYGQRAAGSDTQIQYNDNNTTGASVGLTWNNTTGNLSIVGNVSAQHFDGDGSHLTGLPTYTNESTVSSDIDHNQTTNYDVLRHFLQNEINITESQIFDLQAYLLIEADLWFNASVAAGITSTMRNNWNTSYGWGNHATAGYGTSNLTYALISAMQNITYYLPYTTYNSSIVAYMPYSDFNSTAAKSLTSGMMTIWNGSSANNHTVATGTANQVIVTGQALSLPQSINITSNVVFGLINTTDVAYGAGWDGNNTVATKNSLYDKIETLGVGGNPFDQVLNTTSSPTFAGANLSTGGLNTVGSITPAADSTYNSGSSSAYWFSGFIDTLYLNPTATLGGGTAGVVTVVGALTTNSDLGMVATKKIYLDGVARTGDTYLYESASNTVNLYTGGSNSLQVTAALTTILGDLKVTGNDIQDNDGTACITFNSQGDTSITGELSTGSLHSFTFPLPGVQSVGTNRMGTQIIIPFACTILKAFVNAGVCPVGADLIFDIHYDSSGGADGGGTTIWSTTANRVHCNDGAYTGTSATFDVTSLAQGGTLTIDCDQIGSTTAGSNACVTLVVIKAANMS
jgi:hypothetical protein